VLTPRGAARRIISMRKANLYVGGKLVRRGRPVSANPKLALTIRLDSDVVAAFKATGRGWQTRINDALKDWLKERAGGAGA
jgi:uncharacterized protein (DUF4415 family)